MRSEKKTSNFTIFIVSILTALFTVTIQKTIEHFYVKNTQKDFFDFEIYKERYYLLTQLLAFQDLYLINGEITKEYSYDRIYENNKLIGRKLVDTKIISEKPIFAVDSMMTRMAYDDINNIFEKRNKLPTDIIVHLTKLKAIFIVKENKVLINKDQMDFDNKEDVESFKKNFNSMTFKIKKELEKY